MKKYTIITNHEAARKDREAAIATAFAPIFAAQDDAFFAKMERIETAQKKREAEAAKREAEARASREVVFADRAEVERMYRAHEALEAERAANVANAKAANVDSREEYVMNYMGVVFDEDDNAYTMIVRAEKAGDVHKAVRAKAAQKGVSVAYSRAYRVTFDNDNAQAMAALEVAYNKARNAVSHGGTYTQYVIEAETRRMYAAMLTNDPTPYHLLSLLETVSHDTRNFISEAWVVFAIGAAKGVNVRAQYARAYKALDKLIRSWRSATNAEATQEYAKDERGQLIAINAAIGHMLRRGEKYAWQDNDECALTNDQRAAIVECVHEARKAFTPTQKRVMDDLAVGYTMTQIAQKMGRSKGTVADHVTRIRAKVAQAIHADGRASFLLIDCARAAKREADIAWCKAYAAIGTLERMQESHDTDARISAQERYIDDLVQAARIADKQVVTASAGDASMNAMDERTKTDNARAKAYRERKKEERAAIKRFMAGEYADEREAAKMAEKAAKEAARKAKQAARAKAYRERKKAMNV